MVGGNRRVTASESGVDFKPSRDIGVIGSLGDVTCLVLMTPIILLHVQKKIWSPFQMTRF
jgi:hypothetical protein